MWNLLFPIFNTACVIVFVVMAFKYWKSHCVLRELLEKSSDLERVIAKAERCQYDVSSGNHKEIEKIKIGLVELQTLVQKAFSNCNHNEMNIAEVKMGLEKVVGDTKAFNKKKKNRK